jgi:hypothetical protein
MDVQLKSLDGKGIGINHEIFTKIAFLDNHYYGRRVWIQRFLFCKLCI